MEDLLSRRFETTLRPTVPARSVGPMTAIDRGRKIDSRPGRAGVAGVYSFSMGDHTDGRDVWLTTISRYANAHIASYYLRERVRLSSHSSPMMAQYSTRF